MAARVLGVWCFLWGAACGAPSSGEQGTEMPPGEADAGQESPVPSAASCDAMDILFVIDNSRSMELEQANLAENTPAFVDVLDDFRTLSDDPIRYRLAVTTTGVSKNWNEEALPGAGIMVPDSIEGEDGKLQQPNECGMSRPWIERGDSGVRDSFACAANVGALGSGWEMPLEAAHLALTSRIADGANGNFVREDALLGIIILTDENDCSRVENGFDMSFGEELCDNPSPVDRYVDIFDQLKGERERWATAVIAGIEDTECESEFGTAFEATRLIDFADKTGDNAVTSSICAGDLTTALADALATFEAACQRFPPIE